MKIRDVIHGSIEIDSFELPIVDSRYFQRLREIKQLGFAEHSFPSATHNRYSHSLGAMETISQVWDSVFTQKSRSRIEPGSNIEIARPHLQRFRALARLVALLHDVGHGPLSHTSEFAMPSLKELQIPVALLQANSRKATHEDYTLKIILDSELTPLIEKVGERFGFQPIHVAAVLEPSISVSDSFFLETIPFYSAHEKINFRPLLNQMISSEIDADRMDYLRRDSLHAGVSYGQFDFTWLVENLTFHIHQGSCYLSLHHKALYALEDFLISRFHMFMMVYFHHKTVIFDRLLAEYFSSPECDYTLPSKIENYTKYTDTHLSSHLSLSSNNWAKRIVQKRPFRMLIEVHSGIPATKTAQMEQKKLLEELQTDLKTRNIAYLVSTSTSELSKYFRRPVDPIFVHYDNLYNTPNFIPLEQCTDLFERYDKKRSITRLYVSTEDYPLCEFKGKNTPLKYKDPIYGLS